MGLKILIVDDSATIRSYIQKNIEMVDMQEIQCFQAKNGKLAYEVLSQEKIDILFLDINMPEMNGVELVDKLHKENRIENLAIFIISSDGSETRKKEILAKGVRQFVRKPFTPEMFSRIFAELLERRAA